MHLYVGLTSVLGHLQRYAERFDLLELRADPARLPNAKTLRRLRAVAPEEFVFSLLIPPSISSAALSHPEKIESTLEAAELLKARWIVLQTGTDVGPSQRARQRFSTLVEKIRTPERRVAWEPRGPWEPEVAREAAESFGIVCVEDLAMVDVPPSDVVYTRLRLPGPGAALRSSALERLAEQIADAAEVYVVIEGRGSGRARARIQQALGLVAGGEDDDGVEEDGDFEEGGESDEEDEDDLGSLN